jgi:hypothetical protein
MSYCASVFTYFFGIHYDCLYLYSLFLHALEQMSSCRSRHDEFWIGKACVFTKIAEYLAILVIWPCKLKSRCDNRRPRLHWTARHLTLSLVILRASCPPLVHLSFRQLSPIYGTDAVYDKVHCGNAGRGLVPTLQLPSNRVPYARQNYAIIGHHPAEAQPSRSGGIPGPAQ